MGAGGSTAGVPGGPPVAAGAKGPSTEQKFVADYDSDVEKQLGRVYKGRREVIEHADGGGQFLAVKPWAGAIFPPSKWEDSKLDQSAPPEKLELEFIYGYRGYDSQDNAFYLNNGKIVYPAAAAGIVYNSDAHTQRFFLGHDDDIICAARHPSGNIVATGQVGKNPRVHVWNPETQEAIGDPLTGFKKAVVAIAFSADGTRLAGVDMDDKHNIHVFELKGTTISKIAAREAGADPITLLKFNPADPNTFCTIAKSTAMFWTLSGGTITDKRGIVGTVGTIQPFVCLDYLPNGTAVTGTADGHLYLWQGNVLTKAVQAHQGSVFAIHVTRDNVAFTAGKDGKIRKWDTNNFSLLKTHDLRAVISTLIDKQGHPSSFSNGKVPVAKSLHFRNGKILVGTGACELIEIDDAQSAGELLVQGHWRGETWGLSVHPKKHIAATAGEDCTLRFWDMDTRDMLRLRILESPAVTAAYNPSGSIIAVGHDKGGVSVYRTDTLQQVKAWKSRKEEIGELKFSPNGRILAVGSSDNFIDLYDVDRDFKLIATCTGHSSYITHFDFSADSEVLRSNCGAYELLFWRVRTGQQLKEPSKLRDVKWATHTCILGWDVQGIWPKFANGTDINSVHLNHLGDLLATADDFGMVNVFRYPVPKPGPAYKRYAGHSAHVTCCRFTHDDRMLMTTGGGDLTLFQWRVVEEGMEVHEDTDDIKDELEVQYENNRSFKAGSIQAVSEAPNESYCSVPDEEVTGIPPSGSAAGSSDAAAASSSEDGPVDQKPKPSLPGAWFTAVRPWLGAIFPPTNPPELPTAKPQANLKLDFVYGYRGHDARENLHFLQSGELVYSTAGVGVAMHPETRKQRYFFGHDDDIVSLAVHPNQNIVATGQVGKRPKIIVWDSSTMKAIKILSGFHERAVTSLGFSADGSRLVSVGMDNYNSLAVWDWAAGALVATARGSADKVFDVNFSPFDNNLIVSCGVKHVSFWLLQDGQLKQSKGLLAGVGVIQTMHCMAFPAPEVTLVGTARGEVYIFQGHKLSKVVPGAHKGGTTALYADKDAVVSGGNDGLVRTWKIAGNGLEPVDSIQLEPVQKQTAERAPLSVRSIAVAGEAIAVGTASSQIILVQGRQPAIINQGLSTGEVWGLATHPRDHLFVTAAEDKSVRLWNADTNVQLSIVLLPYPALCADWSADGSTIAVGGDKGNVTVLNAADLATLKSFKDRKEDISQVKFSPDGTRLAVGSHDNFVDVYEVPSFKKLGTCSGHSSYITHVDWSADTRWLQSTDGAYELLFWDAATCRQETYSSRLRDVEWATWTCTLGWPVQGIWPRGADGTDINAVSRSHGGHLLATADDFGLLKLFAYPAVTPGMPYHRFMGHSAHVTEVAWLNDDSHILTTGGGDRSIFKWEVTK